MALVPKDAAVTVSLKSEIVRELDKHATRLEISRAELIRNALDEYLENHKDA